MLFNKLNNLRIQAEPIVIQNTTPAVSEDITVHSVHRPNLSTYYIVEVYFKTISTNAVYSLPTFTIPSPSNLRTLTAGGYTDNTILNSASTGFSVFNVIFAFDSISTGGSGTVGPASPINMDFHLFEARGDGARDAERVLSPNQLHLASLVGTDGYIANQLKNTLGRGPITELVGKLEYNKSKNFLTHSDLDGSWTMNNQQWRTSEFAYSASRDELLVILRLGTTRYFNPETRYTIT